ncbi:MAG: pilus assembly protein [Sporichthyaceae bacterium]|nr:pilus assembly protein [Sporichthyaceae bacterium]
MTGRSLAQTRRRHWRRRLAAPPSRRDRGDIALELVLLTPIIAFMIFMVIQFALWYHARHVVTVAAQEGARVARAANTSSSAAEAAARARAYAFIDTIGGPIVENPNVQVIRGVNSVVVTVSGNAVHVLPGLTLKVTGKSAGPIEQFVPPS